MPRLPRGIIIMEPDHKVGIQKKVPRNHLPQLHLQKILDTAIYQHQMPRQLTSVPLNRLLDLLIFPNHLHQAP